MIRIIKKILIYVSNLLVIIKQLRKIYYEFVMNIKIMYIRIKPKIIIKKYLFC